MELHFGASRNQPDVAVAWENGPPSERRSGDPEWPTRVLYAARATEAGTKEREVIEKPKNDYRWPPGRLRACCQPPTRRPVQRRQTARAGESNTREGLDAQHPWISSQFCGRETPQAVGGPWYPAFVPTDRGRREAAQGGDELGWAIMD